MAEQIASPAVTTTVTSSGVLHVYSIDRLLQLQYSPLVSKPDTISNLRKIFPTVIPNTNSVAPPRVKRYVPPNTRKSSADNSNGNSKQKYVTPSHRNENKYEAMRRIDFSAKHFTKEPLSGRSNGKHYNLNDDDEDDPEWLEPGDTSEMPVATDHSVEEFEKWKAEMKARDSIGNSSAPLAHSQSADSVLTLQPTLESKQDTEAGIFSHFFPVSPENSKVDISLNTKNNDDFFMSLLNKQDSTQHKAMPDSPVSVEDEPIYGDIQRNNGSVRSNSNSSVLSSNQMVQHPGLEYTFFSLSQGLPHQQEKSKDDINYNNSNKNRVSLALDTHPQQMSEFLPTLPSHFQLEGLPNQSLPPPPGAFGFPPPIHLQVGPGGPESPSIAPGFMGYGSLLPTPGNTMGFPMPQPGPHPGFDPRELPPHLQPQQQKFEGPCLPHQFERMFSPGMGLPLPMGLPPQGMPHHHPMAGMSLPPQHMQIQGPSGLLGMAPPPPGFLEFGLRMDEKTS